jgi:hypothetical protein
MASPGSGHEGAHGGRHGRAAAPGAEAGGPLRSASMPRPRAPPLPTPPCAPLPPPQSFAEVFPHLVAASNVGALVKISDVDFSEVDAVFCCLPHATTQQIIKGLPKHLKIVDLSADFRLRDVDTYAQWWVGLLLGAVSRRGRGILRAPNVGPSSNPATVAPNTPTHDRHSKNHPAAVAATPPSSKGTATSTPHPSCRRRRCTG